MTEETFLQMIRTMVKDKVQGAPLERIEDGVIVRLNQSDGLYGLTVYGPRGYDRMRDIRPERMDVVARKIYATTVPAKMFFVAYLDTDTGKETRREFNRPEYDNEREAMSLVSDVEIYINLELVATNVDRSKFRH